MPISWAMVGRACALAALVGGPLTVILHELGHACVAWRFGWPVRSIAIGRGTGGKVLRIRGTEVWLRRYAIAGHTRFEPSASATVGQFRSVVKGGMVMNAVIASLTTAAAWLCPLPVTLVLGGVCGINLAALMGSLTDLPRTACGQASDGWQLGELRGAPSDQLLSELHTAEGLVAHLLRRLRDQEGLQPQHVRSTRLRLAHALSLLARFEEAEPIYAALLDEPLAEDQRVAVGAAWADAVLSAALISGAPPSDEALVLGRQRLHSAAGMVGVKHSRAMLALLERRPVEAIELCQQTLADEELDPRAQGLVDATVALAHVQAGNLSAARSWAEKVPESCAFAGAVERAMKQDPPVVAD